MDLGLSGKIVLVTGGSKGIGLACAKAFVAEGARVAIVSRSQDNIDQAMETLPGILGLTGDMANEADALTVIDRIEDRLGAIDVLVNSAGAARRVPPDELSPAGYRAAMDAKFFSYINVIDPVVKRMAARGNGTIVNIIGNGGKIASPVHVAGGAANAALMLATAGLAFAYAARGVRVVAVNPGLTQTGRVTEGLKADARLASITEAEALARAQAKIPVGRAAEPGEIAAMVLFLASRQASYVTGVSISMDGASVPVII